MFRFRIGVVAAVIVAALSGPAAAEVGFYYRPTVGYSQPSEPTKPDTIPDAFSIPPVMNVEPGVLVQSTPVFVTGIRGSVTVTVVGGRQSALSLDNGRTWNTQVDIEPGKGFMVRQLSSDASSGAALVEVRVGNGEPTMWLVVTRGVDKTPNPFTIPSVSGTLPSSLVQSEPVYVDGFEGEVSVNAASNSEVSTDGLNWAKQLSISSGQYFVVRMVTLPNFLTTTTTGVTVGYSAPVEWKVTNRAPDRPVEGLAFGFVEDVPLGALVESNILTFYWLEGPLEITASNGGQISIAGGPWTSSATITTGQPFVIRIKAADDYGTSATTTVRLGDQVGQFRVTTHAFGE